MPSLRSQHEDGSYFHGATHTPPPAATMPIDRLSFAREAVSATSMFSFSQIKTKQKGRQLYFRDFSKHSAARYEKNSITTRRNRLRGACHPRVFTSLSLTTRRSTPGVQAAYKAEVLPSRQFHRLRTSCPPPPAPPISPKTKIKPASPFLSSTVSSPSHLLPPRPLHKTALH